MVSGSPMPSHPQNLTTSLQWLLLQAMRPNLWAGWTATCEITRLGDSRHEFLFRMKLTILTSNCSDPSTSDNKQENKHICLSSTSVSQCMYIWYVHQNIIVQYFNRRIQPCDHDLTISVTWSVLGTRQHSQLNLPMIPVAVALLGSNVESIEYQWANALTVHSSSYRSNGWKQVFLI